MERVIPKYDGRQSNEKAQFKSDILVLPYRDERKWGVCINTVSVRPFNLCASNVIREEAVKMTCIEYAIDYSAANAPLAQDLYNDDVGNCGLFLCSPMARTVTGITLYVDNGLHAMGMALDSEAMKRD